MKITWLDLNASYSHSSLALPAIHAQVDSESENIWTSIHTTINLPINTTIERLLNEKPDIVCATAWLFTHDQLHQILSRFKQLSPSTLVALGGPEFLGDNEEYLNRYDYVDIIFRGEGELIFHQWLEVYNDRTKWATVDGACFIDAEGEYNDGAMARVMRFDELNAPEKSAFFPKDRPFIQFETTRGCFNTCAFCVSGSDKPVRFLSMEAIRSRLIDYYDMGITSIRMLDRTFNAQQRRAIELLDLFKEFDGRLNFHLEVHPAFLNDEVRHVIAAMPKGLLHIEAGIQSLNQNVLDKSTRLGSLEKSLDGLRFLSGLDNVEVHADLIAGLPDYTLEMIVDDVYTLSNIGVDEIQLETLKLLPGTQMKYNAKTLGLSYSPNPPYEILRSNTMSFTDLKKAMQVSRVMDLYYNTDEWQEAMRDIMGEHRSFIVDLCKYIDSKELFDKPLSQEKKSLLLLDFCKESYPQLVDMIIKHWILAGLSMNKLSVDIKSYNELEEPADVIVELGDFESRHRNYIYKSFIWGYDRTKERQKPVYFAQL